jgi:serine protease Do
MMSNVRSGNTITVVLICTIVLFIGSTAMTQPVVQRDGANASPFATVYEMVSPAVVLVEVESVVKEREATNRWDFFNRQFQQRDQQERPQSGMGSGVIVDREGHVLTNNHVIQNPQGDDVADKITVTLSDDIQYIAEVIGRDPQTDLAVLKLDLDGKTLPVSNVAVLGDSDTLKPGDYAIAIGNPLGLERSITVGVISALGRGDLIPNGAGSLTYQDFIQTDAQINPGNSGGALCDIDGKVIGINDMYAARYAGIGFAIPINLGKRIMIELIAHGEIKRGFVGIRGDDISPDIMEAMELDSRDGALVDMVEPGYPGDKAGFVVGDIIVSLNGETIHNYREFQFKIAEYKPGETVRIVILRDDKQQTINLTLADRDDFLAQQGGNQSDSESWRGIGVVDVDAPQARPYDLEGIEQGVVVVRIDPQSHAADTNLNVGDVIVEINNSEITSVDDFNDARKEFGDSEKPILIYRLTKRADGTIMRGFIAVKP